MVVLAESDVATNTLFFYHRSFSSSSNSRNFATNFSFSFLAVSSGARSCCTSAQLLVLPLCALKHYPPRPCANPELGLPP